MNKTVVIRLVGGLGNQMFQYAAALGLANRTDRIVKLDVSSFGAYTTWPYQLNCLQVPQDIYTGVPLAGPAPSSIWARILLRLKGGVSLRDGVYIEPNFHFDPSIFRFSDEEILLDGYFQSPRYFEGVEVQLREQFRLKMPLTESGAEWAEKINASPCSVSLHVRRGDYLAATASGIHAALSPSYYDRAITLIQDLVGFETEFFLFSDEPDFVAHTFAGMPRANVVRTSSSAPWEDMFLMAQCRHNIIANSSYSWWGAWLNMANDKRVIAPAQWFTADKLATCNVLDLYPNDWILLK